MDNNLKPRIYSRSEGLNKIMKYCAYQFRCQQEVRNKLYEWGLNSNDVEWIIAELIKLDMINEERFARAFARGKFRIKNWGRIKIKAELKRYQISDYLINVGLKEIDEEEYNKTIVRLITKEGYSPEKSKNLKLRFRISKKLMSKGFELEKIQDAFNSIDD